MSSLLKPIDRYLDSTTMYSLVWQGLMVLFFIATLFGFLHILPYSGLSLLFSLAILSAVCYVTNYICAKIVSASVNLESAFITALILFFILAPAVAAADYGVLILAAVIAMASKYILAIRGKHIFNPAAISIFLIGLFGFINVIWWISTIVMLPFVIILGFLILRKIHKFRLFFTFAIVALILITLVNHFFSTSFFSIFTLWPLIFFGTIMLTEPLSTPSTTTQQTIYGVIVGMLFGVHFQIGPLFATPEFSLICGNMYAYIVSPKYFSKLTLREKKQLTPSIYELSFTSEQKLSNVPGQYMEWTLPHDHMDSRGARRYFTVASSRTESEIKNDIKIGIRVSAEKGSSFKKKLLDMQKGDTIRASGLAGDFVLPSDTQKKLAFIAGGIGITPFRSMVKHVIDERDSRDIILLYSNKNAADIAYKEIFDQAEKAFGMKTVYVNDRFIDMQVIQQEIPDYTERMFYLSGPPAMVESFQGLLESMGVKNIKTDFFPGFTN